MTTLLWILAAPFIITSSLALIYGACLLVGMICLVWLQAVIMIGMAIYVLCGGKLETPE